jgi:hypothetical protein
MSDQWVNAFDEFLAALERSDPNRNNRNSSGAIIRELRGALKNQRKRMRIEPQLKTIYEKLMPHLPDTLRSISRNQDQKEKELDNSGVKDENSGEVKEIQVTLEDVKTEETKEEKKEEEKEEAKEEAKEEEKTEETKEEKLDLSWVTWFNQQKFTIDTGRLDVRLYFTSEYDQVMCARLLLKLFSSFDQNLKVFPEKPKMRALPSQKKMAKAMRRTKGMDPKYLQKMKNSMGHGQANMPSPEEMMNNPQLVQMMSALQNNPNLQNNPALRHSASALGQMMNAASTTN